MTTGWGRDEWGLSPWGTEIVSGTPPVITPLDPVDGETDVARSKKLHIRLTDAVGIVLSLTHVSVNGLIWVLGGVGVNGAVIEATPNDELGFDLLVTPPAPYPISSRQEVLVIASNTDSLTTSLIYSFLVGVGLRLLNVTNPFENALTVYFNRSMRLDTSFFQPTNWIVTPVSPGAQPLTITNVSSHNGQARVANLRYIGGGSTYELGPVNLVDSNGEPFESGYGSVLFEILFGSEPDSTIRLFNSIFGPLGISQRVRTRRSIDDHVSNRAMALALDEQFRLRMQRLDATAGRDGRPGKRRT